MLLQFISKRTFPRDDELWWAKARDRLVGKLDDFQRDIVPAAPARRAAEEIAAILQRHEKKVQCRIVIPEDGHHRMSIEFVLGYMIVDHGWAGLSALACVHRRTGGT